MNVALTSKASPYSALRTDAAEAVLHPPAAPRLSGRRADMRRNVGEFVGNIFYGTLIRQMHASSLKTKYLHGGRAEDAFQGQLGIELAQRLGRSLNNPIADRLFNAIERRLGRAAPRDTEPAAAEARTGLSATASQPDRQVEEEGTAK